MKDLITEHGVQASVVVVLVLFNVILTALKSGVDALENYLAPGVTPDPNSKLEKIKALASKILGYTSSVIDWLTGNKEH